MAVFKFTWDFEMVQPQIGRTRSASETWSETWYRDVGDGGVEAALRIGSNPTSESGYIKRRRGILGQNYRITMLRVSNVLNPRLSKEITLGFYGIPPGSTNRGGPPVNFSDAITNAVAEAAVLVDFVAPAVILGQRNHHRHFAIRGLPRSMFNGNNLNETGDAWQNLIAFCNVLGVGHAPIGVLEGESSPWLIRVATGESGLTWTPLTGLEVRAANDRTIAATSAVSTPSAGGKLLLRKVGFPLLCNRVWNILSSTGPAGGAPGTMILGTSPRRLAGDWDNQGEYQLISPRYIGSNQYVIKGKANRQTAGPLAGIRGRRRAR